MDDPILRMRPMDVFDRSMAAWQHLFKVATLNLDGDPAKPAPIPDDEWRRLMLDDYWVMGQHTSEIVRADDGSVALVRIPPQSYELGQEYVRSPGAPYPWPLPTYKLRDGRLLKDSDVLRVSGGLPIGLGAEAYGPLLLSLHSMELDRDQRLARIAMKSPFDIRMLMKPLGVSMFDLENLPLIRQDPDVAEWVSCEVVRGGPLSRLRDELDWKLERESGSNYELSVPTFAMADPSAANVYVRRLGEQLYSRGIITQAEYSNWSADRYREKSRR